MPESWRGVERVPADAGSGVAAGDPPFSRGQALPGYRPDFNGDEVIWGWAREEVTGNLCLGSRAKVQERVGSFLRRSGQPEGRSQTVLPDSPPVKGRRTPAKFPT